MDSNTTERNVNLTVEEKRSNTGHTSDDPDFTTENTKKPIWHRERYLGALLFNILAFLLPALYITLSKLWVANIDSSLVVTTDVYSYMGTIASTLNSGLPKAVWLIIGDKTSREPSESFSLAYTVILFQAILGLVLSIAFLAGAETFASGFVPAQVREISIKYVRITAFSALSSSLEKGVSSATRALDEPDVSFVISLVKVTCNIVLDILIISWFHIGSHKPTVNDQASIRVACDLTSAFFGLAYFIFRNRFSAGLWKTKLPTFKAFKVLLRPSAFMLLESAIRNGFYLWTVRVAVAMGEDYATAWGIFNTIRWGLLMVPVQALNTTTLTFVGHNWGKWRKKVGIENESPKATLKQLRDIAKPAFCSIAIALAVEIPTCISFHLVGAHSFAYWLSGGSTAVTNITVHMWRTIDWCYLFFAVQWQLVAILQATLPAWFLWQSLWTYLLWVLPWAIVCQVRDLNSSNAWTYQCFIVGGNLVFAFFACVFFEALAAWKLVKVKLKVGKFRGDAVREDSEDEAGEDSETRHRPRRIFGT